MIVEDEAHFHDLYAAMLEDTDYRIISAYDKNEALSKLKGKKPDLIILDMRLKTVTANTFFINLKSISKYARIPVIIISALSEKYLKELKKTYPNLVYITKSYLTKGRLLDEIGENLSCSSS